MVCSAATKLSNNIIFMGLWSGLLSYFFFPEISIGISYLNIVSLEIIRVLKIFPLILVDLR